MANNDPVNSENAVYYYLALKRNAVKADLHIYALGGHGFGLRPSDKPCSTWPAPRRMDAQHQESSRRPSRRTLAAE